MPKYNAVEIFEHLTKSEMESLFFMLSKCCIHEQDSIGKQHYHVEIPFDLTISKSTFSDLESIENKSNIPLLSAIIHLLAAIKNNHLEFVNDTISLYNLSQNTTMLEDRIFIAGKDANILFDWKEELKKILNFHPDKQFLENQKKIQQDQI